MTFVKVQRDKSYYKRFQGEQLQQRRRPVVLSVRVALALLSWPIGMLVRCCARAGGSQAARSV